MTATKTKQITRFEIADLIAKRSYEGGYHFFTEHPLDSEDDRRNWTINFRKVASPINPTFVGILTRDKIVRILYNGDIRQAEICDDLRTICEKNGIYSEERIRRPEYVENIRRYGEDLISIANRLEARR